jgi:hypothetical protein
MSEKKKKPFDLTRVLGTMNSKELRALADDFEELAKLSADLPGDTGPVVKRFNDLASKMRAHADKLEKEEV